MFFDFFRKEEKPYFKNKACTEIYAIKGDFFLIDSEEIKIGKNKVNQVDNGEPGVENSNVLSVGRTDKVGTFPVGLFRVSVINKTSCIHQDYFITKFNIPQIFCIMTLCH